MKQAASARPGSTTCLFVNNGSADCGNVGLAADDNNTDGSQPIPVVFTW